MNASASTALPHTPLKGYATKEASHQFAQKAYTEKNIATGHFRDPLFGLTLSSMGIGSYLGAMDPQGLNAEDDLLEAALIRSVTSGAINVIDTAINYRAQRSERAIGKALKALQAQEIPREALFIASKNGYLSPDADSTEDFRFYFKRTFIDSGILQAGDVTESSHSMAPQFLAHQLDCSLNNLGLETLDLMYLHNAAESQLGEVGRDTFMQRLKEAFVFYESARKAGKIRFYGMATWDCFRVLPEQDQQFLNLADVVALAESVAQALNLHEHGFRFVQLPFNLAFHEAATLANQSLPGEQERVPLLQAAYKLGIGIFTSVPLLQGHLLKEARLPQFPDLSTPAQNCIQLVRSHPGIVAPLIGQKQAAHVEENLKVAYVPPVSQAVLDERIHQL